MNNQQVFDQIISLINVLNINFDDLYNHYKMNKNNDNEKISCETIEEIIEEIADEVINQEIKKETKTINPFIQTETKRWADYSDDEDDFYIPENKKKTEKQETKTFSDIVKNNIQEKKQIISEKKEYKKPEKKEYKKPEKNINTNIVVIENLQQFLDFMRNTPKNEYIIEEHAHCEHTYNGTLCDNVKKCKKIHIQRCINGNNCEKKRCPYIHLKDMPTESAKDNFVDTMEQYNQIKSKKRVCC
jgi:hypothetical protein